MKPSRRKFLQLALSAPLAATLRPDGTLAFGAPAMLAPDGQPSFENPQIIKYDASCFTLHGRDTFVMGACFHYARCPRELWEDRLAKLKQAGFNTIATYIFWNYHEPVEGHVDMSELEAFIELVQKMGFYMIVRPGPYACAEWDAGGFPHWIVARQFPLRSDSRESIETSQHWFNSVLPVIQKHTITNAGPIIMIQVENEYDFWRLADAEKRKYVAALAQMVWNAGIDVPVITNWCKQARENSYPDMAKIMDTADFYPRWNIVKETLGPLAKLRQQEPDSPVGVTELQGGWFSKFGGKLSVDQPGVDGAQLNMLTKTMIEHGVTYYNYYMGFGGTNFQHAAKTLTTTYDYAAPIREPGGLWEKYYDARGICEFVGLYGAAMARAKAIEGTSSTNSQVSITERVNGQTGFIFVRENANANQQYKLTFPDPASPSHRLITTPRQGQLALGAREMKMLPVGVALPGSMLRYTTAEVLGVGANVDRVFLIVYDERGRTAEIAVTTEQEPHVEGDTVYQYWDSDAESVVLGIKVARIENMWLVNNSLQIIALPRDRALRTWIAHYPLHTVPDMQGSGLMDVPFITDCAWMREFGAEHQHAWAELDFAPGVHHLTTLWPSQPDDCRVDGAKAQAAYDEPWRTARLVISTPPVPAQPQNVTNVETWVEKFDLTQGDWLTTPPRALELLGEIPYGYVKYRAEFTATAPAKLSVSAFCDDAKQVFVNGASVAQAPDAHADTECDISNYIKPGSNVLEIAYESFGSPNFGPTISELKGIRSAHVISGGGPGAAIDSWKLQRAPAAGQGDLYAARIDPGYPARGWQHASLGAAAPDSALVPAFCWIRAHFSLDQPPEEWTIPWKAIIEADRDALLYLNGKFVGRYETIGPQHEFYLPDPWINWGASGNILTVILAYTESPQHIKTLSVSPYSEFSARRTRVEFRWS